VAKYSGIPVFSVYAEGNTVAMKDGPPPLAAEARGDVRIVVYQLVGGDPLLTTTGQQDTGA